MFFLPEFHKKRVHIKRYKVVQFVWELRRDHKSNHSLYPEIRTNSVCNETPLYMYITQKIKCREISSLLLHRKEVFTLSHGKITYELLTN